jgi:hypothetical protein
MKSASYKAERRSTVGSYIDADCLLKNTSAKQNIYVDNEKSNILMKLVLDNVFGRIRVVLFYNIRIFSA